jgi:hypothetical protein
VQPLMLSERAGYGQIKLSSNPIQYFSGIDRGLWIASLAPTFSDGVLHSSMVRAR